MKKFIMIITFCLLYLAAMAQQPAVDVVTLKNGSVIRGKIIEQSAQVIKIYTTNRSMVEVKPEEVEKMTKEASSSADQGATIFDEDSFAEGSMIIGGSGSFRYIKEKEAADATLSLAIDPTFAFFFMDGLAVGASLPLSYYSSGGEKGYILGIGPVIKYYTEYLMVVSLSGSYNYNKFPNYKGGSFKVKPSIGMAFFLNPKVSLEPALFYQYYKANFKDDFGDYSHKTNTFGIEVGLTIFL